MHRAPAADMSVFLAPVSDVAPILWQYGALARLKKGETIDKLFMTAIRPFLLDTQDFHEMCMRMTESPHTDPEVRPLL